jgi:uncharacterized protein (DUF2141 family)
MILAGIHFLLDDSLVLTISGWKGNTRCMGVAIYDEDGFKRDVPNFYSTYVCLDGPKQQSHTYRIPKILPDDRYVIAIFQDLNGNQKLDKNTFGIPTEPYVFSGKMKSKWKKPIFNEVSIMVKNKMNPMSLQLKTWEEY